LTVVQPGEEAAFLAPLPVRAIWGVGPVTAEKLAAMGVETVGDLARVSELILVDRFGGEHGAALARRAHGVDRRPVVTEHERKSVSRETTFGEDLRKLKGLKLYLWRLSKDVARRLKRGEVVAGTISVKLRYGDFETLTPLRYPFYRCGAANELGRTDGRRGEDLRGGAGAAGADVGARAAGAAAGRGRGTPDAADGTTAAVLRSAVCCTRFSNGRAVC